MKRPRLLLLLALGAGLGAASTGCDVPDGQETADNADNVQVVRSALAVDGLSEAAYLQKCIDNHVPSPPKWGMGNLGTGNRQWTANGSYGDSFVNTTFNGTVYSTKDNSAATPGTCILNLHTNSVVDVICQGNAGKACFWEGKQPTSVPSGQVTLVPNGNWGTGSGWLPIVSPESGQITPCTSCHTGQNAFLAHNAPNHPLNPAGKGWMPSARMDPLVRAAWAQNSDPGTMFNAYPKSNCLTCHSTAVGGTLPKVPQTGFQGNYCQVLGEVTNRPAAAGGMPPVWPDGTPNLCTPDLDCAQQNDPFVRKMLSDCGFTFGSVIPRATPGSPVALYGRSLAGPSFTGDWEHVLTDNWSGTSHDVVRSENFYNYDHFNGWSSPTTFTAQLATPYKPSMYVKDPNLDGSKLSMVTTRYDGSITEKGPNGTFHNINTTLAAGAPYAYVRNDGQSVVVYRGYDDRIHEIWWNGSSWAQDAVLPNPTGGNAALGDPIGYVRNWGTSGSSSVLWVCGNGTTAICEARLIDSNHWDTRVIKTKVTIKDDGLGYRFMPQPNRSTWGTRAIAYVGVDGAHVIMDPSEPALGATTEGAVVVADTTIDSAAVPYSDQNGFVSIVYRAKSGSTSSIIELRGNSSGGFTKTTVTTTTSETLTDDPTVFIAEQPWLNTIIYRNSAYKVYQSQWSYSTNGYVKSTVF